jgi:multicopper oxidase
MLNERDAAARGTVIVGRRGFLLGAAGGLLSLSGCGFGGDHPMDGEHGMSGMTGMGGPATTGGGSGAAMVPVPTGPAPTGPIGVSTTLRAAPTVAQIGARQVETWAYNDTLDLPALRLRAGERVRATLENALPEDTTIHWHGVALRNAMDGLPGMTQDPVRPGASFLYDFVAPDPGTYFFHPHVGTQADRGLAGVLVVEDPAEPLAYDAEVVVTLDDWLDGIDGRTPDTELRELQQGGGMHGDHAMHGMGADDTPLGSGGGDVDYPLHLINGRPPEDPATIPVGAGQRVRLRLVNAAADTAYRVALDGHRMRVTHADGWPVEPVEVDALVIGMGERYDVLVDVTAGAWQLYAACEGKPGAARAILRTTGSSAPTPPATAQPAGLTRRLLDEATLVPTEAARLAPGTPGREIEVLLTGGMGGYEWGIGDRRYPDTAPISLARDERVRLVMTNHAMMWHPMHLHGHTFAVSPTGVRRDTVKVRPMSSVVIDVVADNPGRWMLHCHNAYHLAAGMAADVMVA